MIHLLIHEPEASESLAGTRFGGRPLLPSDGKWPSCRTCKGAMQFLGQVLAPAHAGQSQERLVSLFMCQNDPGMCNEWDANSGGNSALVSPLGNLEIVEFPSSGEVSRHTLYGARILEVEAADYSTARETCEENQGIPSREVLGQLQGQPEWIQSDETPSCDACQQPMRFLAQLEEGPDYSTAMNFGSGCAYVFDCACSTAKMLWQQ